MLVLRSVTVSSEPETNKRRSSKRHVTLQVTACYLIYCLGFNNCVNAQGERAPPGVPPSQYQANPPPSPQGDIKFHDPTEFATNNVGKQDYVNTAKSAQAEAHAKVNAPHAHQAHGHGIGENLDAGHMKEHEKDNFVDFSKMTQPQIIMHHFRQFDQNKDGKVDGLEIFKKIQMENEEHTHTESGAPQKTREEIQDEMDKLAATVDMALKSYDENDDGYIYYGEFYRAHTKNQDKGEMNGISP